MIEAESEPTSSAHLTAMGYDESEAQLVSQAAAQAGLPLEQFASDLMAASIHETGHQLMAVWQGCSAAKAYLSLVWPGQEAGRMVAGNVVISGIPDRLSGRRAVAVAGVVAEWLMHESDGPSSEDEWDLFDRLRDGAWMSPDEVELTDGKITWHAVKRASKLLRRHWKIVGLSSASKRKDLLFRLGEAVPGPLPGARGSRDRPACAMDVQWDPPPRTMRRPAHV